MYCYHKHYSKYLRSISVGKGEVTSAYHLRGKQAINPRLNKGALKCMLKAFYFSLSLFCDFFSFATRRSLGYRLHGTEDSHDDAS
jgi:hypothetical protein